MPGAGGGRQPGAGRPPSALRALLRESFADRIQILCDIADDEDTRPADRLRAIEVMLRVGLGGGERWDTEDVRALVAAMARIIRDEAPEAWERIRVRMEGCIVKHYRHR